MAPSFRSILRFVARALFSEPLIVGAVSSWGKNPEAGFIGRDRRAHDQCTHQRIRPYPSWVR